MSLSAKNRQLLKDVARDAIETVLLNRDEKHIDIPEALQEKAGAFVTLKKHGELRGCVGYTGAVMPLVETVKRVAVQAAFNDPRFSELDEEEWGDTDVEISVLTPMRKIAAVDEIEVGTHGLYVVQGGKAGLLLPQVATEYEWDAATFLEYTCLKAGLPRDAWKEKDTEIYIFSAEIF